MFPAGYAPAAARHLVLDQRGRRITYDELRTLAAVAAHETVAVENAATRRSRAGSPSGSVVRRG